MHSSTTSETDLSANGNTRDRQHTGTEHHHSSITLQTKFDGCGPRVARRPFDLPSRNTTAAQSIMQPSRINGVEHDHHLIYRVDLPRKLNRRPILQRPRNPPRCSPELTRKNTTTRTIKLLTRFHGSAPLVAPTSITDHYSHTRAFSHRSPNTRV